MRDDLVIFLEKIIAETDYLFKSGLNDVFHWCVYSAIFWKYFFNFYTAVLKSWIMGNSDVLFANNLTVDMISSDRSLI